MMPDAQPSAPVPRAAPAAISLRRLLCGLALGAAAVLAGCVATPPVAVDERSTTAPGRALPTQAAPPPEPVPGIPLPGAGEPREAGVPLATDRQPVIVALIDTAEREARAGELEKAAAALERALRIDAKDASLWHRLARIRLDQGQTDQAVHLASKSNTLAGLDASLRRANWLVIARAHRAAGDEEKARAAERNAGAP